MALAQNDTFDVPSNLGVRLGIGYSLDDDTRDLIGDGLLGVGFDYTFDESLLPQGETYLSIDWLGEGISGDKGNIFPIFINQRFFTSDVTERFQGNRSYYFVGVGGAIIDVTSTASVLAVRGGLGYELGEHVFVEGALVLSDIDADTRATSIGGYVGYRF